MLYCDKFFVCFQDHFQVLFVAADVLALSNIPSTNHCRIHARFAKGGLATKISFTGTVLIMLKHILLLLLLLLLQLE